MRCNNNRINKKRKISSNFTNKDLSNKKVLNKLNKGNSDLIPKLFKTINIPIKSSSKKKKYNIELKMDKSIYLLCNCGEQFGVGKRKNCKHVATILKSLFTNFVSTIKNGENEKTILELENLFNKFQIKN